MRRGIGASRLQQVPTSARAGARAVLLLTHRQHGPSAERRARARAVIQGLRGPFAPQGNRDVARVGERGPSSPRSARKTHLHYPRSRLVDLGPVALDPAHVLRDRRGRGNALEPQQLEQLGRASDVIGPNLQRDVMEHAATIARGDAGADWEACSPARALPAARRVGPSRAVDRLRCAVRGRGLRSCRRRGTASGRLA
jgi:hypothetical protein